MEIVKEGKEGKETELVGKEVGEEIKAGRLVPDKVVEKVFRALVESNSNPEGE